MLSHLLCFVSYGKRAILWLSFSPVGYWLLKMNFRRRQLRDYRRDTKAKLRRKVLGKGNVVTEKVTPS